MQLILDMPMLLRLAILFVIGTVLGGQINRGIYRLAWYARQIGPWSAPDPKAPPRKWSDRIPIIGWLGLRRESAIHGKGYWLRPLLIELCMGIGLAALYWLDISHKLIPLQGGVVAVDPFLKEVLGNIVHYQYLSHAFLICMMMVATFIDFDEKTIPDAITLPGTLVGFTFATLMPASLPLTIGVIGGGGILPPKEQIQVNWINASLAWPLWMSELKGLGLAIACYTAWIYAIAPKTITMRRGLLKCGQYLVASFFRSPGWKFCVLLLVAGNAAIAGIWYYYSLTPTWNSLLTSLVGMAFGGGIVWAVRVIGSNAMGQEAMGFGDVTVMAMIGSFWGWQASLIIFFIAPFAAVVIAVTQFLFTGKTRIAFGPYLCLGTLIVMLFWPTIWMDHAKATFETLGPMVPLILVVCLGVMHVLLLIIQILKRAAGIIQ